MFLFLSKMCDNKSHLISEFSPSFVRVIQRLKPIVETWLITRDSELEGRIFFRDSKNQISAGVTEEWFQQTLGPFKLYMSKHQVEQDSVDTIFSDGIRETKMERDTYRMEKKLLQRLDTDVIKKKCGFRIQLKLETKREKSEGHIQLIRKKKRISFNPKGEFSYDFTIVQTDPSLHVTYEMEIEAIRDKLQHKQPSLIATSLVCKLLDWVGEKPATVELSIST